MGFWKNIGEGIVSTGRSVAKGINNQIEISRRKNARWEEYKKLKLKIVGKLSLSELKNICKEFGAGEPRLYLVNPFDGSKESLGNPRDLYLKYVIKHVPLDNLIEYGRKKRISVNEIIRDKERLDKEFSEGTNNEKNFESEMSHEEDSHDDFELVLNLISQGFDPENVRDEKDLENQLKQWLRAKLEDKDIRTQYKTEKGEIDLVIDKKYGIELKLVETKKVLQHLLGQINDYIKVLGKGNLAVILLVGKNISYKDLEESRKDYQNIGAKVLILEQGRIKRKKKKTTIWLQKQ